MATLEPNSDELVKMVFSAPIHLCPVLYPNKKEEQDVEEEVHHHHHEHTKLEEHHNHHLTESIEEVAEEEHCHHEKEHEHIHEEHHHHDEIHRSQSPLSNCTSVSEPSVYPEHEHHHHHEEYEHVEHNVHEHIVHITRYEEHVSEEHCYEEPEPLPGYIDEELHRENVGEPDVPEPDHEPEIVCHEHDIEAIDENFSRPADGFMLEVEHQSVVSTDDDDEGESHMSYNVHDHHSVSEEVVPAKSEEHDRVIQELKAQQNQVAPDVDGYKVTCWHDTDSCLEEGDDGEDERVVAVRHVQYHFDSNLVSKFTHSKKHHDSFQTALHAALRQRNPLDNENNVHENVETEEDYEHPEYVEHEEKAESVKDHPVVNPRTFVHHVKDVTEKVEEQLHYEEPHHEDDRNTEAEPFEYHHHHHHHEEEHHYHHESEPVGLIRAARTISTRSEDIPLNEDAQREVSEAPGVRSLLNRFESGNVVHDEETFVNDSRRSSLQTSVYEGRAREILQEVLGLSDDDSQVNDFLHHNQSPSIHKIEQESLPSAASSRRSSVNTQQSSAKAPSSQKPAYTPPERGVTTPRSAKFNPEKFQSVRVVKSVRNQVRIWGGQELKPRHYSRRVSHVTNIGTLFEEPSKQVEEERVVLSEKRDSVFSSVSQPSKHSHRAPSTVGQASKRSSVSSVVSNGSTLVSQSASRRTSVASSATLTNTEVKKVVEQKYEYKPPVPKTEPSSVSSTISYRHNAAAKVPISQRKSVFESEVTPAPKRNFVVVRKVAASETSDEHSSSTTKKSESSIGDWKKQVEATF
ncbi:hypothetical protein QR680_002140 [Steinernema hermaphroditum]|uniref:Uncharacterized protein n=1 Tax=Steinernema hermaphroditum TaxID=289476 RepID=A0AA39H1G1_9BILA|nr:hypothetical protein QR680_002140 [Steinernema hermaphroditum]